MEKSPAKNNTLESLLCTGIATGLFALGFYTDPFFLIALCLFIPMCFVYSFARCALPMAALSLVLFGVLVWLMAGMNYAVTAVLCTLPIAAAGGYVVRKKLGFYYSALASCAAILGALGVLILCISLLWQSSMTELILKHVENQLTASPDFTRLFYFTLGVAQGGGTVDAASLNIAEAMKVPLETAVRGLMRTAEQNVLMYVPQLCASFVALFGLLDYIIPRAVIKKRGGEVGRLPVFAMWCLPKRFGTWSLVLLVVSYLGVMLGWNNFDLVYSIVMGFLNVIYSLQGMAFIDWLLKKKVESRGARVALIAVTFVLTSFISLYMWIGFFEQIVKIRKRNLEQA